MERIENILDDKCSKVFATEILDIDTGLTVRTINYNSKICMEISASEPTCRLMYSGIDKSPNSYINTLASKHEVLRYNDSPIHDAVELFLGEELTRYVNKIFMDVQSRDDIEEIENILLLDIKSTVNNFKNENIDPDIYKDMYVDEYITSYVSKNQHLANAFIYVKQKMLLMRLLVHIAPKIGVLKIDEISILAKYFIEIAEIYTVEGI